MIVNIKVTDDHLAIYQNTDPVAIAIQERLKPEAACEIVDRSMVAFARNGKCERRGLMPRIAAKLARLRAGSYVKPFDFDMDVPRFALARR